MITSLRIPFGQFLSRWLRQGILLSAFLPIAMMFAVPTASAQQTELDGCMQDIAGFSLGCTANDIQVSGVLTDKDLCDALTSPSIWDPDKGACLQILDDGCAFPDDTVDFTAVFEVVTTAKRRHDIGIYFVTDGDPNGDGAISGACSISTMPHTPDPPWLDLDGTDDDPGGTIQDTCGDIDKPAHNPLYPQLTLTATCADPDEDGQLNLPNCTSWRQFGANELCTSPLQAFPGSPSKCRCDEGFQVPIDVPSTIVVDKKASPGIIFEPGADVTFTVRVDNPATSFSSVLLTTLFDDVYGPVNLIPGTSCSLPQTIAVGGSYECSFTVFVSGQPGIGGASTFETDVVFGTATNDTTGATLNDDDDAVVEIQDVPSTIIVEKRATPGQVQEPGADVIYDFKVTNTSLVDTVTINLVSDDHLGIINGSCNQPAGLPADLAPGDFFTCQVTQLVEGNFGDPPVMNTVTASGLDDDGNSVSDSDNANVSFLNDVAAIEVIKSATCSDELNCVEGNPTLINEPGGEVTYDITVTNISAVDTVTIDTVDDPHLGGDISNSCDVAIPVDLLPGGSFTCQVKKVLEDVNAGDDIPNTVTASGVDDDVPPKPVSDSDSEIVTVQDVPPAASLLKTATMVVATFEVEVTNESSAEALFLDELVDDQFCDITTVHLATAECGEVVRTDCQAGPTISIDALGTYTCSFDGKINLADLVGGDHIDTVTGTLSDDDVTDPELTATPSDSATVSFQ